jgi:hypothetical protein
MISKGALRGTRDATGDPQGLGRFWYKLGATKCDLDSIVSAMSSIDVRECNLFCAADKRMILDDVRSRRGWGAAEVLRSNGAVGEVLRSALAEEGMAARRRMPAAEQGTSALLPSLGGLLCMQGKLDAANDA